MMLPIEPAFLRKVLDRLPKQGYSVRMPRSIIFRAVPHQGLRMKGWQEGNLTIVLIKARKSPTPKHKGWNYVGVSKRNPRDKANPAVGLAIAQKRALIGWLLDNNFIVPNHVET